MITLASYTFSIVFCHLIWMFHTVYAHGPQPYLHIRIPWRDLESSKAQVPLQAN